MEGGSYGTGKSGWSGGGVVTWAFFLLSNQCGIGWPKLDLPVLASATTGAFEDAIRQSSVMGNGDRCKLCPAVSMHHPPGSTFLPDLLNQT